jgi:hypothetical protein
MSENRELRRTCETVREREYEEELNREELQNFSSTLNISRDQMKEGKMDGVCSTYKKD